MLDPIQQIFSNLDCWRHLPSYQLERRFDIFLTPYLQNLLIGELGLPDNSLHEVFIPEFPLLKKPPPKTAAGHERKLSNKVDFVFFEASGRQVYFVEFKTDRGSIRKSQLAYLLKAQADGFNQVLDDLNQILQQTGHSRKYYHLLRRLEHTKRIEIQGCDRSDLYPTVKRGFCFGPNAVKSLEVDQPIEVVMIVPEVPRTRIPGWHYIDFNVVASYVKLHADAISKLVAQRLVEWQIYAGASTPRDDV